MATILRDAAAEASPLRKLEAFDRGMTIGFTFMMDNLLTNRVDCPGPDETWPLRLAILLLPGIPHLESNAYYIGHFYEIACSLDPEIEQRFMQLYTSMEIVKGMLDRYRD
jgi:hypothetical protein